MDEERAQKSAINAQQLATVFSMLQYDVGYLSPRTKTWFTKEKATAPKGFIEADQAPRSTVIKKGGLSVGVVLFPALPQTQRMQQGPPLNAGAPQYEAIIREAQKLRQQSDVVVALSGWGMAEEKNFLNACPAGVFDVLLGGGKGFFFSQHVEKSRTLWLRPFPKGRAVQIIDFFSLPTQASKPLINTELVYLSKTFPSDKKISSMLPPDQTQ